MCRKQFVTLSSVSFVLTLSEIVQVEIRWGKAARIVCLALNFVCAHSVLGVNN